MYPLYPLYPLFRMGYNLIIPISKCIFIGKNIIIFIKTNPYGLSMNITCLIKKLIDKILFLHEEMTHIQSFCLNRTLPQIKATLKNAPYHIKIKETDTLISLMYDQTHSDFSLPIVQECRGIILEKDTYRIVCWPFTKFFNYGEKLASSIDWSHAQVQEKLDGSIMKMYYYNQKWNVSSNRCIEALPDYKGMFDQCLEMYPTFCWDQLDQNCTYIFELIHPDNIIVIRYNQKRLVHLGTRNNVTGQQYMGGMKPFHSPSSYPLTNLEQCIKWVSDCQFKDEGFVVVDQHYNRIKIKSPKYVLLSTLKNHGNYKEDLISCVIRNEVDEFISYLPVYAEQVKLYQDKLNQFISNIIDTYQKLSNCCQNQKQFAVQVIHDNPREHLSILFHMYKLNKQNKDVHSIVRDFLLSDLKRTLALLNII